MNQSLVDMAAHAGGMASRASREAESALVVVARHLRSDHGWGRRKVARMVGKPESWVRDNCEVVPAKRGQA